jgi:phosphoribosylanthranilate isomerase
MRSWRPRWARTSSASFSCANRHATSSLKSCESLDSRDSPLFVGVFRDQSIDEVRRIAELAQIDVVQLHGAEDDDYVRALGLPVVKAFRVGETLPETTSSASWIMFDTGGGTGRPFDWSLLATYPRAKPFFLAGGLTPDNVADAIRETRPDAVDVSSGVESAPGIKDPRKLRDFFERVRRT